MAGVQVVRVESYTRAAMSGVGREQLRDSESVCRNADIDRSRTVLNVALKKPAGGSIGSAWHTAFDDIKPGYKERKDGAVMDQMIVTSGPEFFAGLGWKTGMGMTPEMDRFFHDAYKWAVSQVGFKGSDRNILAATVHLDETTPHMHVAYIPVAESWRSKVYELDEDGKVKRNPKGSPIGAKDERGRQIWKLVEEPRLSHTAFWSAYGGSESEMMTGRRNISYSLLQDSFHVNVGIRWKLDRGEIGSDARHESHHKRRTRKARRELEKVQSDIEELKSKKNNAVQERDEQLSQLDASITEKQQKLSEVQSEIGDLEAVHERNLKDRGELEEEKRKWEHDSKNRIAEANRLDRNIAEKKLELSRTEERLGDVASAADLQLTELPAGKASITGRKVTYTPDEDARLKRLANTGLVSQRLESLYHEEQQKSRTSENQVKHLESQMAKLASDVEELSAYKEQASRVPDLEQELQDVKNELHKEQQRSKSLSDQVQRLRSLILEIAGIFAAKVKGALEFIRDRIRARKMPNLAEQVVLKTDAAAELDEYIQEESVRAERRANQTSLKKQYSSWER